MTCLFSENSRIEFIAMPGIRHQLSDVRNEGSSGWLHNGGSARGYDGLILDTRQARSLQIVGLHVLQGASHQCWS